MSQRDRQRVIGGQPGGSHPGAQQGSKGEHGIASCDKGIQVGGRQGIVLREGQSLARQPCVWSASSWEGQAEA